MESAAVAVAAPWGALPQAEELTEAIEDKVESVVHDQQQQQQQDQRDPEKQMEHGKGRSGTSSRAHTHLDGSSTSGSLAEKDRIHDLARSWTQNSVKTPGGDYVNPFESAEDRNPLLDPTSPRFSARAWIKNLVGIQSRDPERYPGRTAGLAYRHLSAHGYGQPTDYQKTLGNYPLEIPSLLMALVGQRRRTKIQILRDFDGLIKSGEMLVVLGRPGSGCSTLLKTISGETSGYYVSDDSYLNYQGIPKEMMHADFRGECIYQAEIDVHFPQLTVGQTLDFAARARAPRNRFPGVSRDRYAEHMRDVVMAIFGLSHTLHTKVGSDFIRGVSGGERKRVSIAEVALGGSPLQCWDNSTRGLDSATALEFVRTLRLSTEMTGSTAVVAIYQASQSIYEVFDKVAVLYEGRQIYFGHIHAAKSFFVDMGFECPSRQTTADYLTSLTSPAERVVRQGFEGRTPSTPDEFAARWQQSADRAQLLREIEEFDRQYPLRGDSLEQFQLSRRATQARRQRVQSPYTLSVAQQVQLCFGRGYQRLRGDMTLFFTGLFGQVMMALVIGSVFYNLPNDTNALYSRGALIFFAILISAFQSALVILTLYAQRPIVEKQSKYAFYHPSAEALASIICDLPNQIGTTVVFDLTLYFLTNLRRTPGHFFVFFLVTFVCTLSMSMWFRSIASLSRTISQALAPTAIFILALVIYTGFAIPTTYMHPWFRWLNYVNPVAYAFEALMINEFHGRVIPCSRFIPMGDFSSKGGPNYGAVRPLERICATTGAQAGRDYVDGDRYLEVNFQYDPDHLWRNFGILIALGIFALCVYLAATEFISAKKSKGEVLLFPRRAIKHQKPAPVDVESNDDPRVTTETVLAREKTIPDAPASIQKQTAVFHWDGVNYDIKIKGEPRRLLDDVDGWVKPGTLTALMGVSGAGKTTLLDVLASRTTMGVVSGQMLVDGRERNTGFQRKTGYVQQQDLHLETSTVREALSFSAMLRQPRSTPLREKLAYVDEVIKVLEMEAYADAVVGVPGEGLNVEQRKRLTIGVEMAAKPALLLFLDEPTSGLDSQTAWSICALLRKLADNGQAILCTIHQPSAILFQEFDRLLFLAKGGKTVYFGEVGDNSQILTGYFERHGARACRSDENPAEWMLEVIGAAPGSTTEIDWPVTWSRSAERAEIKRELADMREKLALRPALSRRRGGVEEGDEDPRALDQFAAPMSLQMWAVLRRVFQQYWRTPSYLYSKVALCVFSGLFIGFSFWDAGTSLQGLQNQLFSIFMLLTIFSQIVQQIMPHFVTQRSLYEVRERPSKTYSWKVFMLANILVEIPWNTLMGALIFFCWYYPIGLYRNAEPTHAVAQRGGLMFLFIWSFLMFASTFAHAVIAGMDSAENAGNIANLMFSLCLIFCGVLAPPNSLPGFWIFMYRVSPFTYLVSGVLSTGLANTRVVCTAVELLRFNAPSGTSCETYLADYTAAFGGYLASSNASSSVCEFCSIAETNAFLDSVSASYSTRWRNFGIMFAFVGFNTVAAVFFYWLFRVPKGAKKVKAE